MQLLLRYLCINDTSALKVLPAQTLADEAARKGFRREALTLSKLNHPNIATVFDFDADDHTDFLVTEYITGVTLDAKLAGGNNPSSAKEPWGGQR